MRKSMQVSWQSHELWPKHNSIIMVVCTERCVPFFILMYGDFPGKLFSSDWKFPSTHFAEYCKKQQKIIVGRTNNACFIVLYLNRSYQIRTLWVIYSWQTVISCAQIIEIAMLARQTSFILSKYTFASIELLLKIQSSGSFSS